MTDPSKKWDFSEFPEGFLPVANRLAEEFAKINLSSYESRVIWVILRKTYGFHRKKDFVSVSQIQEISGLDRRHASRAKKSLLKRNILVLDEKDRIGLHKNYEKWTGRTIADLGTPPIANRGTPLSPIQATILSPVEAPQKIKDNKKDNIYSSVINYLNYKSEKNFKSSSKKTSALIDARINEGFNLADFIKVIDKKVAEWKNDSTMDRYLRPETLFGNKFEGYLNQRELNKKQKNDQDAIPDIPEHSGKRESWEDG
jgi:phage replication O-like protein O